MDQVWKGLSNLDPRDPGGFYKKKTALKPLESYQKVKLQIVFNHCIEIISIIYSTMFLNSVCVFSSTVQNQYYIPLQ